jgi:hypothetical protein
LTTFWQGIYFVLINVEYQQKDLLMSNNPKKDKEIRLLIQKCRNEFRRPENINFYSENDLKEAEKKFVKFSLTGKPKSNSN